MHNGDKQTFVHGDCQRQPLPLLKIGFGLRQPGYFPRLMSAAYH